MKPIRIPFTNVELVAHTPMSPPKRDGQAAVTATLAERASDAGWLPLRAKPVDRPRRRTVVNLTPAGDSTPATLWMTPGGMTHPPLPPQAIGRLRPAQPAPQTMTPACLATLGADPNLLGEILAEKRQCGWTAANGRQDKLKHRLAALEGSRTALDKAGSFIEAVVNGRGEAAPSVTLELPRNWTRHSRRLGQGIATLDVRTDLQGNIVDVRPPTRVPPDEASPPTWDHPGLFRSSSDDRRGLRSALLDMMVAMNGFTPYFGRTPKQHAQVAWQAARETALNAEGVDPTLARIPLEDRIAVVLYTRRPHAALNRALSSGDPALVASVSLFSRVLTSGLNQLALQAEPPRPLYRGMHIADPARLAAFLAEHSPGRIVANPRFVSASNDSIVGLRGFGGNVTMSFVGPISAKPLGALTPNATHQESVYPAGTQWQVLDQREVRWLDGPAHHITLLDLGQSLGPTAVR
jgi:hypothetical protein